jgi:putative protease
MLETQKMTRLPKLLAPAGSIEAFKAALAMGADEIFLGLKQFNARKRANNFSIEDLNELVPLAKANNVKVLVTLNVLIQQQEFSQLVPLLQDLEKIGIGGVIVQDLGVARFIRDHFPSIRMHASTQMAIHNIHGVEMAMQLGFKRVVLAREMTLQEIKKIRSVYSSDQIELESFCHGSLCYSYSGLCFFSGAEGGRSGNRGECAYTCRKPYKILSEPGHGFLFSMKDLDTSELIQDFIEIGVDSLKIEGRKKDAQYVATAVKQYRELLDQYENGGKTSRIKPAVKNLLPVFDQQKSFGYFRSPTTFFLKSRYQENVIDLNHTTHQGQPIGKVKRIEGRKIYFDTATSLEAHDGIKILPSQKLYHAKPQDGESLANHVSGLKQRYKNQEIAFGIQLIHFKEKKLYSFEGKGEIALLVPKELPLPKVGDEIFKVRSNALKRAVDQLLSIPTEKSRTKQELQAHIELSMERSFFSIQLEGEQKRFERLVEVQKSPHKDTLKTSILDTFSILGDIATELNCTSHNISQYAFISKSTLKELKREFITWYLENKKSKPVVSFEPNLVAQLSVKPIISVKIDRPDLFDFFDLPQNDRPDEIIFEPKKAFLQSSGSSVLQQLQSKALSTGVRLRIGLPLILRSWDEPYIRSLITTALELGIVYFDCPNIGALKFLQKLSLDTKLDVTGDFAVYALNSVAVEQILDLGFSKCTLSIEDDKENLKNLLPYVDSSKVKAILYKDTPLFIAESCSLTALHNGCPTSKVCGYRTLVIEGEDKEQYEVHHELCKSFVLSKKAHSWTQHKKQLTEWGISHFQFDFLTRHYTFDEAKTIFLKGKSGEIIKNTTDGNFNKKLL